MRTYDSYSELLIVGITDEPRLVKGEMRIFRRFCVFHKLDGVRLRESDVHLPERLGIYQSVGDTAGPGGIIRALHTIPIYVAFAEAIQTYAPDAWVINYTNPMALCVRTLYKVYPGVKAFGCCREVFGTQKVLRDICELS